MDTTRVQINRDPFARITLTRETVEKEFRCSCSWCGSREGKFIYWIERDSAYYNRDYPLAGEFCSVSCARTYHELEI